MRKEPGERDGQGVASQRVADILAERILSGALRPGARIKQDDLAEELRTSRIPVRDALRILETRGLVQMRANAGARVAELNARDLELSYEIRERIEPLLLAESIPHLTPADIAEMHAILRKLEAPADVEEAVRLGRDFHWASYRRHQTPLLAQMVERLWDTTQIYRHAFLKLSLEAGEKTHDLDHVLFLDSVERGEIATAQAALVMHIRRARQGLARHLHAGGAGTTGQSPAVPPCEAGDR